MSIYTRWTHGENATLGNEAAHHMYRGLTELNAFRMAQSKLTKTRQRDLSTIAKVPEEARLICKTTLQRLTREAKRIVEVADSEDQTLSLTQEQRIHALEEQLHAAILRSTQVVETLTRRVNDLEDMLLDYIGDDTKPAQPPARTNAAPVVIIPKITVIGVKPEQEHILRRDFPGVKFTFVHDGKAKLGAGLASNHLVIVTRWNSDSTWTQVKGMPNAKFVDGGMSTIKQRIAETINALK